MAISDEMMIMREAVGLEVLYGVWLQGLIKTMKNLRQDNLC
jgi:hypothetical protein